MTKAKSESQFLYGSLAIPFSLTETPTASASSFVCVGTVFGLIHKFVYRCMYSADRTLSGLYVWNKQCVAYT